MGEGEVVIKDDSIYTEEFKKISGKDKFFFVVMEKFGKSMAELKTLVSEHDVVILKTGLHILESL